MTEHKSAIHVAAMLSDPSVMEPFAPARFGGSRTLLFSEKTGRSGARKLLEQAGRDPTDTLVNELLDALSDRSPLKYEEAIMLADRL